MSKLIAINNVEHKNLKVDLAKAESHGATMHLAPAVLSEFSHLVMHYPIVLTKNGETGQFNCTVMLGFQPGENLFWQDEKWQALYLPLQVRRQPFFLGKNESSTSKESEYLVCFDSSSPSICDSGEAIFNDLGEETPFFQAAKARLAELLRGESEMHLFIEMLLSMELVKSMSIDIKLNNGESMRLNGLYTINTDKLAALTAEQLFGLNAKNYLQAIYCMVISIGQMYSLIERKNQLLAE